MSANTSRLLGEGARELVKEIIRRDLEQLRRRPSVTALFRRRELPARRFVVNRWKEPEA